MNVEKMRHQLARSTPCGARFNPRPGAAIEVCTLTGDHDRHNWPSLPTDPVLARRDVANSTFRLAGMAFAKFLAPTARYEPSRETPTAKDAE